MAKFALTITADTIAELMTIVNCGTQPGGTHVATTDFKLLPGELNRIINQQVETQPDDGPTNTAPPVSDAAGLAWDERIHSNNKALNTDGTWRKRRGVSADTVVAIENELRGRAAAGMYMPQVNMNTTMPPPIVHAPQHSQQMPPQTYQQIPPPSYMPPQTYQQPSQQQMPGPLDFNGLMQHIMPKTQSGQIDAAYLSNLMARVSHQAQRPINVITDLSNNADMIPFAVQCMQQDGRW